MSHDPAASILTDAAGDRAGRRRPPTGWNCADANSRGAVFSRHKHAAEL